MAFQITGTLRPDPARASTGAVIAGPPGRNGQDGSDGTPGKDGSNGAPGRDGLPGVGTIVSATAVQNIPASTVVVTTNVGYCDIADPTNAAHQGKVIGIVAQAVSMNGTATISSIGPLSQLTGTFGASDRLWIGDGSTGRLGSLVNQQPSVNTAAWLQTVGTATSTSAINILLGTARGINRGSVPAPGISQFLGILTAALDSLPALPADPSLYPSQGGLFREGDANGYRVVRLYPYST